MLLVPPSLFVIAGSKGVSPVHVVDFISDRSTQFILIVGSLSIFHASELHEVLVVIKPPSTLSIHVLLKISQFFPGELNLG